MRRSAFLLAGAVALALSVSMSLQAQAGWHLDNVDYFDDEGDWVEFWSDDEGHILIFVIEDGETIHYIADGFDNPNPEDGSGSEEDLDHLQDILKKHGGGLRRLTNIAGTPLGHALLRSGGLIDPYHNPGDAGYEDTAGGGNGGGGITPGDGSPTDQLKRHLGKGHEDGEDDDDDGDTINVGLFTDDMPGPPEIVNPNPVAGKTWEHEGGGGRNGPADHGGNAGGGGHAAGAR